MPRDWIEISPVRKRDPRAAIETRARVAAYSATAFNAFAWLSCALAILLGAYAGTRLADQGAIDGWVDGVAIPRIGDIAPAAGRLQATPPQAVFAVDTDGRYYGELQLGNDLLTVAVDPLAATSRLALGDLAAVGIATPDDTAVVVLSGLRLAGQPVGAVAVDVDRQPGARSVLGQDIVGQLEGWTLAPISARQQAALHRREN